MIVFELISKSSKKVLVANYTQKDERLFPIQFAEAELIGDGVVIPITEKTNIRRYTESGFLMQQFYPGEQVILSSDGKWERRRSLESCFIVFFNKLEYLLCEFFYQELFFKPKNVLDKLGFVELQQDCSFINLPDINIY